MSSELFLFSGSTTSFFSSFSQNSLKLMDEGVGLFPPYPSVAKLQNAKNFGS